MYLFASFWPPESSLLPGVSVAGRGNGATSSRGSWTFTMAASLATEHSLRVHCFSSCSSWALEFRLNGCGARA